MPNPIFFVDESPVVVAGGEHPTGLDSEVAVLAGRADGCLPPQLFVCGVITCCLFGLKGFETYLD